MRQKVLQAETQHEAVGDGEGTDRQQRVCGAEGQLGAVDALAALQRLPFCRRRIRTGCLRPWP